MAAARLQKVKHNIQPSNPFTSAQSMHTSVRFDVFVSFLFQELDSLNSQLTAHLSEFELSESEMHEVTSQIKAMDDVILKSQAEVEVLEEELRVVNLQVFNLSPEEEAQRETTPEKVESCELNEKYFIVHCSKLH